jgi:hypothetical protein
MRIAFLEISREEYAFLGIHWFELLHWSAINLLLCDHACIKYMAYVYPNENTWIFILTKAAYRST